MAKKTFIYVFDRELIIMLINVQKRKNNPETKHMVIK